MAYSKGLPTWGAHLAEDLERVVALHDASNIAAVVRSILLWHVVHLMIVYVLLYLEMGGSISARL